MNIRLVSSEEYPVRDDLPLKVAVFFVEGIKVEKNSVIYKEIGKLAEKYKNEYQDIPIGSIPGVQDVRVLFRALGLDPTKRRPSSESLLRRAIKGKEFYSINNLVDIGNLISLKHLLPVCIYDSAKIIGDVEIRLGRVGESYLALNKSIIDFQGRIVYADADGPFGSPMTDSVKTSITDSTTSAFCQILAPINYSEIELQKLRDEFIGLVQLFC